MIEGITLLQAFSALGTAVSVIGSISEGKDASRQANFQATTQRQQAVREREVAAAEEDDFRRQQSRRLASIRAAGGASGVEGSTGTSLLATDDFVTEAELQALRIRSGGNTSATRLEQQAALTAAAGKSAKKAGFAKAGASLLTGFSAGFGGTPQTTPTVKKKIRGTQSTFPLI